MFRPMLMLWTLLFTFEILTLIHGEIVELSPTNSSGSAIYLTSDVPGRNQSLHYKAFGRVDASQKWTAIFVMETTAKVSDKRNNSGYFAHLNGWTSSFVNIETTETRADSYQSMQILVQRIDAAGVKTGTVHPVSSGATVDSIDSDGVVVMVPGPAQFMVDFDGGMDETDTGPSYTGPPMHTFSVFVNRKLSQPDPTDPMVHTVAVGEAIPTNLQAGATVLFSPGIHFVPRNETTGWRIYQLLSNVTYFVPMDAVWHSALSTAWRGSTITLIGNGAVSGEDMSRWAWTNGSSTNLSPQGLTINGAETARVEGITFIDFPNHHLIAGAIACERSVMRNVKVMGWRANGDGLHVFGGWDISELFMRTQDDSMYMSTGKPKPGCAATTFDRITTWNDANGAAFITCGFGTSLTNSDAIYARASWEWWSGGRVFCHRAGICGGTSDGVTIDNVRVEDALPSMNAFQLVQDNENNEASSFANTLFKNIAVKAASTQKTCANSGGCNCVPDCPKGPFPHGLPNVIGTVGTTKGLNITNLRFENCSINDINIKDMLPLNGNTAVLPGWFNVSKSGVFNLTAV